MKRPIGGTNVLLRTDEATARPIPKDGYDVQRVAFMGFLLVALFYLSYRYPLQINNSLTSPTYRDTPLVLQGVKYALLGCVVYLAATSHLLSRPSRVEQPPGDLPLLLLGAWASLWTVVHVVDTGSLEALERTAPLLSGVWMMVASASWVRRQDERLVHQILFLCASVVVVHAMANVGQIALYVTTGRLPALGYAGGLVRFGGLWDDPNQTATFSALGLAVLASGRHAVPGFARIVLIAAGLLNLLLAWSYSGWLALLIGLAGVYTLRSRVRLALLAFFAAFAVLLAGHVGTVGRAVSSVPVVSDVIEQKAESVVIHIESFRHEITAPALDTWTDWIAGSPTPAFSEIAYLTWLHATGVVGLVLLLGWIGWATARAARTSDRDWIIPVIVALLVGSIFVPYLLIFPVGPLSLVLIGAVSEVSRTDLS